MLRTRTPLSLVASYQIPLDLHVLGLPLAFILSQDQTLHCMFFLDSLKVMTRSGLSLLGCSIFNILMISSLFTNSKPFRFRLRAQK